MEVRIKRLLARVLADAPTSFVGVGLIVYTHLDHLPYLPLCVPSKDRFLDAPAGEMAVAQALIQLSTQASPWHDGFHFLRQEDFRLTHVSQFVSPPISVGISSIPSERGARHMTAALASKISGISLVGVLPVEGSILLFKDGGRVVLGEV